MDTNSTHGHDHGCHEHDMSGDQRHWRHVIIRILVALFIFWAGVQFGQLTALVHSYAGYGYGMMHWSGQGPNQMYFRSPVMMGGSYGASFQAEPVTTTTVTVPAPVKK